jgi:hypothetical protein
MKRAIVMGFVLLSAAVVSAADFDIDGYCHQVSKEASDRHAAEKACREQERNDQQGLDQMAIPDSVAKHCREIAQGVGGSYQVMRNCVKQEMSNQ